MARSFRILGKIMWEILVRSCKILNKILQDHGRIFGKIMQDHDKIFQDLGKTLQDS